MVLVVEGKADRTIRACGRLQNVGTWALMLVSVLLRAWELEDCHVPSTVLV